MKSALVIGPNSMLGKRLRTLLGSLGYVVYTAGRTKECDIRLDLRDSVLRTDDNDMGQPYVFHCAASFHVVCCGLFTQKLDIGNLEMFEFLMDNIGTMFSLTRKSMIFNVMSRYVNFFAPNLFYKSPVEMLACLLDNMSKKVVVDHASMEYEYIVRVEK